MTDHQVTPLTEGIVCALTTPFGRDETPDSGALQALIDRQVDSGIHGVFVAGTSGEGPLLNRGERRRLAEAAVGAVDGRIPLIIHCGAADTRTSEHLAEHAAAVGADAVAIVAPYFFGWGPSALYQHFRAVAEAAAPIPAYIYENPERVGYSIGPELVGRLFREVSNIVGVKDTGDSIARLTLYLSLFHPAPHVYTGNNSLVYPAMKVGARGGVSALANITPKLFVAIYEAAVSGDDGTARGLQETAARFQAGLRGLPYIPAIKHLLGKIGMEQGHHRRPHAPLTDEQVRTLEKSLSDCEGLEEWLDPAV